MSGQFLVEPEPALVPDPELPALGLDDGVDVDGFEVELVPELPVVVDVVAALAASAPPATRPDVSAPMASTLRSRICMAVCPFVCVERRPIRAGSADGAPWI
jgi:hypothetical protein